MARIRINYLNKKNNKLAHSGCKDAHSFSKDTNSRPHQILTAPRLATLRASPTTTFRYFAVTMMRHLNVGETAATWALVLEFNESVEIQQRIVSFQQLRHAPGRRHGWVEMRRETRMNAKWICLIHYATRCVEQFVNINIKKNAENLQHTDQ